MVLNTFGHGGSTTVGAVFLSLSISGLLLVGLAVWRNWRRGGVRKIEASQKNIEKLLDDMIPIVYRPSTDLLAYYWEQIQCQHYYFAPWARNKNNELYSDILISLSLFYHILGILGWNIIILKWLKGGNSCLRRLQASDCNADSLSHIFQAAAPLQTLALWMAPLLEDYLHTFSIQKISPEKEKEEKKATWKGNMVEYGREWEIRQRRVGTLLRAARLHVLRFRADFLPIRQEGDDLFNPSQVVLGWEQSPEACQESTGVFSRKMRFFYKSCQYRLYDAGSPHLAQKLLVHAWQLDRQVVYQRIRRARYLTHSLLPDIRNLVKVCGPAQETSLADLWLMRLFFVYWFGGLNQRLAKIYLLEEADEQTLAGLRLRRREQLHRPRHLLLLLFVLLSHLAVIAVLAYFATTLDRSVAALWGLICAVAHLWHALILLPTRILLQQLYLPSFFRTPFNLLHRVCSARWKYILSRERGAGWKRNEINLVQHFHPACRIARAMPQLFMSRVLLTLRDWDLAAAFINIPRSNPPRWESPWLSGSPLIVDGLQICCYNIYRSLKYFAGRALHHLVFMRRGIRHICLLPPRALRHGLWESGCAIVGGSSFVAVAVVTQRYGAGPLVALLAAYVILFWSLLGQCFLFLGPATLLYMLFSRAWHKINNYFVREKPIVKRKSLSLEMTIKMLPV
eukprot:gene7611-8414_t